MLIPLQSVHKRGCEGQNALPPPTDSRIQTPHHPPKNVGSLASLWGGGGDRYHRFMQRVLKPLQSIHRGVWGGGQVSRVHVVPAHATTITTQGGMGGGRDVLKRLFVRGNMGEGILGGKSQKMSSVWLTSPLEVPSITCCPPLPPFGTGTRPRPNIGGHQGTNPNAQQYQIQRCVTVVIAGAPPQRQQANTHLQIGG